jgi:hypothetical protein
LDFNRLFLKLNPFVINCRFSPIIDARKWKMKRKKILEKLSTTAVAELASQRPADRQ